MPAERQAPFPGDLPAGAAAGVLRGAYRLTSLGDAGAAKVVARDARWLAVA